MRKTCKAAAAAAALLCIFIMAASAAFAETGEETSVTELVITLDRQHGRCRFEWEGPEDIEYTATLQSLDADGVPSDLISDYCPYSYFQADDFVAYCCQEYGVSRRMRVRITGKNGTEVAAEGYSEEFDAQDFWPDRDVLNFGDDIPLEDISWISWNSTGETIDANWSYTAHCYNGKPGLYFRTPGKQDREIRISNARWNKLLSLVSEGRMEIRRIMDPTIVILDGRETGMDVSWDERNDDHRLSYYGFRCDDETKAQIQKLLTSAVQWSIYGWKLRSVLAACIVLICSAVIFFIKRGRA